MSARVQLGPFFAACLLCSNADAQVVEALAGHPFGVARVTLSLDPSVERSVVETNGYRIESDSGHVLYPAFSTRRILGIIRDIIGTRDPGDASSITAWFLFRGREPFDITVYAQNHIPFA